MSVLSDYFAAPSDEAAARMVTVLLSDSGYDVVEMTGVAPNYDLVPVEVALTGRSREAVQREPRNGKLLASVDQQSVVVVTVSDELTVGLAAASGEHLAKAAEGWSEFEDFQGEDSSWLPGFLNDLVGLARRAIARDERLYCKISC